MSLSDSLVFTPKPSAVSGSRLRSNFPAYNAATFSPGATAMINVACGRRGQYLNPKQSFLKFSVKNNNSTSTNKFAIDYSASSFIQRIDVYHASVLLESISEYGALYAVFQDLQGFLESQKNAGNVLEGFDGSSTRVGAEINGEATSTFCVPLLLGTVGCLQSKYLPIGAMSAGDIRIEITWANQKNPVVNATYYDWTVSSVEFLAEVVEINSQAQAMIEQANAAGYTLSYDSFFNHSSTVANGTTSLSMLIPAKYQSLKTLFTIFRKDSNFDAQAAKTISERINPIGTGSYYYQIAGHNVPATPVKSTPEAFAETMKALHAFSALDNGGTCKLSDYGSTSAGTFVIGMDLETLSHKSKVTDSGVNTVGATILLNATLGSATTASLRADTWAHFDGWLVIANGQAMARF